MKDKYITGQYFLDTKIREIKVPGYTKFSWKKSQPYLSSALESAFCRLVEAAGKGNFTAMLLQ